MPKIGKAREPKEERVRYRSLHTFAAALVLGAAVLACSLGSAAPPADQGQNPSANPSQNQQQSSPPAAPLSSDPKQAVIDAYARLDNAYPYRLTEISTTTVCDSKRTVEFAAVHEYHAVWSGCFSGESIETGGKTYYLVNGGWSQTDQAPPGAQEQVNVADLVKQALENVQLTGADSLNGAPMNVYSFDLDDPVLKIKGGQLWIGTADGLPHQVKADMTFSGIAVNTTLLYEFGVAVNIQPPIP
jgi:hypothetical protein